MEKELTLDQQRRWAAYEEARERVYGVRNDGFERAENVEEAERRAARDKCQKEKERVRQQADAELRGAWKEWNIGEFYK